MSLTTLSCDAGFLVVGMVEGEDWATPIRVGGTLIAVSVISSWTCRKIKRLSLFFSHWLSGLVLGLGYLVEDMMLTVCWAGSSLEGFIKFIKFVELVAANMLAITNLAICVNLALIVSSHRTVSRVTSVSSFPLLLLFLVISIVIAAAVVPFWEDVLILGTGFFLSNPGQGQSEFIIMSLILVEFIVGICMFFIVAWLLLFRMTELKECWKLHVRIRYYFGLTALGTAVNMGLGICGVIYLTGGQERPVLIVASWVFRYVHIALDTVVLYGVLRERHIDERGDGDRSDILTSGQAASKRSGGSHGKPVPSIPVF